MTLAAQADGKYVMGGYHHTGTWAASLWRYNADGSVDTTFATSGEYNHAASNARIHDLVIDSGGNIIGIGYLGGITKTNIYRFDSTGALDTSWDTDGMLTFNSLSGNGVAYELANAIEINPSDGNYIIAGQAHLASTQKVMMVIKVDKSSAALNTGFNTTGIFTSVGVAGGTGALDTSFGGGAGYVVYDSGNGDDEAHALAIQRDGKIVVVGSAFGATNIDMAVWRFSAEVNLGGEPVCRWIGEPQLITMNVEGASGNNQCGTTYMCSGELECGSVHEFRKKVVCKSSNRQCNPSECARSENKTLKYSPNDVARVDTWRKYQQRNQSSGNDSGGPRAR